MVRMLLSWPWFLFSLLVCLSAGYLYLLYTDPAYRAVASLMVQDEKKGGDLMNNPALKEIGLGGNAKLVENEIEILKSYDLMEDVVDSLRLFISVKKAGRIKDLPAFGDEIPFSIEIINPEAIGETRNWTFTESVNTLRFQSKSDRHSFLIRYGQIYNAGAYIHFQFQWVLWNYLHRRIPFRC